MIILLNIGPIFQIMPIESEVSNITINYLKAISIGALSMSIFTCLRCFSEGMTLTMPVFFIAFSGMLLNIPLDIILVNGLYGFPKLGGVGCGIATSVVSLFMTISMITLIIFSKHYKKVKSNLINLHLQPQKHFLNFLN